MPMQKTSRHDLAWKQMDDLIERGHTYDTLYLYLGYAEPYGLQQAHERRSGLSMRRCNRINRIWKGEPLSSMGMMPPTRAKLKPGDPRYIDPTTLRANHPDDEPVYERWSGVVLAAQMLREEIEHALEGTPSFLVSPTVKAWLKTCDSVLATLRTGEAA